MSEKFSRTEMLLGAEAMKKLNNSRVAVFGIGGVGGYVVEALARSGVGSIDLIDNDTVNESNINRQIIALTDTVGRKKVDVAKERLLKINPNIRVITHDVFYTPETAETFDFREYDYIVDAIDTVSGKIDIAVRSNKAAVPVISSMGAGNKLDATAFEVTDIYKTSVCPLAKVMRKELRERGIKKLKVVYSREIPIKPNIDVKEGEGRRHTPGSVAFVPSVVGLIIASEVIKELCEKKNIDDNKFYKKT